MKRKILGAVAGLVVWVMIVVLVSPLIRAAWPEYVKAAATMEFTLPMKLMRLTISAVATVVAGWVAFGLSRGSLFATLLPGVVLLVGFIPEHIKLWDRFPVWYHLTFLVSLVPLCFLGGKIGGRPRTRVTA